MVTPSQLPSPLGNVNYHVGDSTCFTTELDWFKRKYQSCVFDIKEAFESVLCIAPKISWHEPHSTNTAKNRAHLTAPFR